MPQLKIQLSEWKSVPAPGYDIYGYGNSAVEHMNDRIRMLRAKPEIPEGISSYTEWITEFVSAFEPELQEILGRGRGRDQIQAAMIPGGQIFQMPDWNTILEDGDQAVAACRDMAFSILSIVLAGGSDREEKPVVVMEADEPIPSAGQEEPEDQQEKDGKEDREEPGEPEEKEETETPEPVIPAEFFGKGPLPKGVAHALKTDKRIHTEWRRGLATAESVLRTLGAWLEVNEIHKKTEFVRIGLALFEFQEFKESVDISDNFILPRADISVPVEPPRHLLAGNPVYDNKDLTIHLAPFFAEQVRSLDLREPYGAVTKDGGAAIVMRNWSQTDPGDLGRLSDLFLRLRNLVRRPRNKIESQYEDEVVIGMMAALGCKPVPGLATCWRFSGGKVVGARPVFHYRDGIFHKQMLQMCMVLGPRGEEPIPAEFTNRIIGKGAVASWEENGLLFVGYEIDDPQVIEGLTAEFTDFTAFADELQVNLVRLGSVENVEPDKWLGQLKPLPTRLEVDFDRTRRHWRRLRQVAELKLQLDHESVEAARSVIGRAENEDDRNHLRAQLVVLLFQRNPEEALAELEVLDYGRARHEAVLAVLEAAVESEEEDLLHRCFGRWIDDDALRPEYDQDCLPVFELVAAGAGLETVHEGYSDELSPAVRCDWLNFIFRRSPRSRHDPVWLTHMDGLTNDAELLGQQNLDRLSDLYLVARRHDLPGRSGLMAVIRKQADHSPFRAYYEDRLGQPLGGTQPQADS